MRVYLRLCLLMAVLLPGAAIAYDGHEGAGGNRNGYGAQHYAHGYSHTYRGYGGTFFVGPGGYYYPSYYNFYYAPYYDPYAYAQAPVPYVGQNGAQCEEYLQTVLINGQPRPSYGHACLQADGTWQAVD